MKNTFNIAYLEGHPVVARKDGRLLSAVVGFKMFPDGVSWADNSVLDPLSFGHGFHHLVGPKGLNGYDYVCEGITFTQPEQGDFEAAAAWNYVVEQTRGPADYHRYIEWLMRKSRMNALD